MNLSDFPQLTAELDKFLLILAITPAPDGRAAMLDGAERATRILADTVDIGPLRMDLEITAAVFAAAATIERGMIGSAPGSDQEQLIWAEAATTSDRATRAALYERLSILAARAGTPIAAGQLHYLAQVEQVAA